MNLRTNEVFKVVAVAPSGAKKVMAQRVGAFKATRLFHAIKAKGFDVEIRNVTTGVLLVLED